MNNLPLPQRIAILYSDAKREYFPTEEQFITEVEVKARAGDIAKYLNDMKIDTALFPGDADITANLKKYNPDFVINLVDSVYGQEHLCATISASLELLRIPYTGSGLMGQAINSNKYLTRNLLEQWGLTIPKYQLITEENDEIDDSLDYPLFVKLNEIHGSVGINSDSICQNEKQLKTRIKMLMDLYHQPILIEEFIMGREITVIVFEGVRTKVYAAEKILNPDIDNPYKIVTFDWNWNSDFENAITYQKYELPDAVKDQVKTAFDVLKMEDYAKFDLRLDLSGRHYFIDANANPALGPKNCAISSILDLYDISFEELLRRLIQNTLSGNSPAQNHGQI
jgi:D-alanine-D-alanine ligase